MLDTYKSWIFSAPFAKQFQRVHFKGGESSSPKFWKWLLTKEGSDRSRFFLGGNEKRGKVSTSGWGWYPGRDYDMADQIINLERNALSNAQYMRREILEINPVLPSVKNVDLEEKVCDDLSLTGTKVKPDDLDACHRMKKKAKVIIKFKYRKQRGNVIFKWKELK